MLGVADRTAPASAAEAPGTGALDNNAKSSRNRLARWEARGFLWEHSGLLRVRKCGRVTVRPDGRVGVRANGQSVGFAGLHTCGSVWACPCCNQRVQQVRRLEVGVGLATVLGSGGGAAFGAITVRHRMGQPLTGLLDGLTYGIARIARDKSVSALRDRLGYVGRIQALEFTHGAHGHHPHRHPLAFFERPVSPDALVDLHLAEFRAFRAGVVHRGLDAPLDLGQVLMPVSPGSDALGDYFTKSQYTPEGVAWEATSTQTKRGKQGSRTPWQLLDSARLSGDADDLDIWHEYETATRGKRALVWSRGLRNRIGLGTEATDEQVAAAEVGTAEDQGFSVTEWGAVTRRPDLGAGLLNAVTPAGDWTAGRAFCRANGIPFEDTL